MAKRGAEALACAARFQSYLSRAPRPKRSRSDLEWRESRGVAQRSAGDRAVEKRKRGPMEGGGEEGVPGKRPAGPPGSGFPKEAGEALFPERRAAPQREPLPRLDGEAAAAAASGDPSTCRLAPTRPEEEEEEEENEDDAWQYSSFQYWRCPLPAIDLCDILDLEKADTFEAGDSNSVAPSEMET